jgi:hypothetical protein
MTWLKRLPTNERGAAVIELALSLPVLITLIYGIFEFCQLYEANAGMQHALGEGARLATLCIPDTGASSGCDNPSDTDIVARENAKLFGPTNFLFFTGPTVTLTRSKQVYTVS